MFNGAKKDDIQRMEKEIKELKYKINKLENTTHNINNTLQELQHTINKTVGVKEAKEQELKTIIHNVIAGHKEGIAAGRLVSYIRTDEKARACGGGGTNVIYKVLKVLEMEGKIKRERQGQKVLLKIN